MTRFADQKVVVTGASRGIGRAIALAFRSEGAWVVGTRTGSPTVDDETCHEWWTADFAVGDGIEACAKAIERLEPDVLVNNAGVNKIGPFAEISEADFQLIQRVNVFAPFRLCQAVIPSMTRRGAGRIVNISSVFGKVGKEQRASYSASKFALDGLTLALAAEHAADGILANCVAPGFIDTELTRRVLGDAGIAAMVAKVPARRLGKADEIAKLVMWLASRDNTYVTGQCIAIDGGFSRV